MSDPVYAWIKDGIVVNTAEWDGNTDPSTGGVDLSDGIVPGLIPPGVIAYIGYPAHQQEDGSWVFDQPPIPVPTPEEILARNTATRLSLLQAASQRIGILQDAIDLGISEQGDEALLTSWRTYRVNLTHVDLTQLDPQWPAAPEPGYGAVHAPSVTES